MMAAHLVGRNETVVAIEPLDKNVQVIYRSIEKNGFGHIRVHACAASDSSGIATIGTSGVTSNGQIRQRAHGTPHELLTQTRRLDDLLADLKRLDLVKFDIEGYELRAWRGFRGTLEKHRPVALTEFHPYCMRESLGIDPIEFLSEIFDYGRTVQVLSTTTTAIVSATPADAMREWEDADRATGGDGRSHLNLMVLPRS